MDNLEEVMNILRDEEYPERKDEYNVVFHQNDYLVIISHLFLKGIDNMWHNIIELIHGNDEVYFNLDMKEPVSIATCVDYIERHMKGELKENV